MHDLPFFHSVLHLTPVLKHSLFKLSLCKPITSAIFYLSGKIPVRNDSLIESAKAGEIH